MSSSAGRDSRSAGGLTQLLCLLWIAGVAMRMTLLVMPPIIPQYADHSTVQFSRGERLRTEPALADLVVKHID
jgi:hypothetical protein